MSHGEQEMKHAQKRVCAQCGRIGTRSFRVIPSRTVRLPGGAEFTTDPFTVCAASEWPSDDDPRIPVRDVVWADHHEALIAAYDLALTEAVAELQRIACGQVSDPEGEDG